MRAKNVQTAVPIPLGESSSVQKAKEDKSQNWQTRRNATT